MPGFWSGIKVRLSNVQSKMPETDLASWRGALGPGFVAEREGFEPSRRYPVYTLSRRAPSTTRPPLHAPVRRKTAIYPTAERLQDLVPFHNQDTSRIFANSCLERRRDEL